MEDKKRDYIVKTFSRTKRKDYENYVINAIWQRLDNLNIKPVTQQYVKRKNGTYALIDLYFPQLNIAIECDEIFHQNQNNKLKDAERELAIEEKLGAIDEIQYDLFRIDASETLERINNEIDNIVNKIKDKYNLLSPKTVWNMVDPVEEAIQKRVISVEDDIRFSNIYIDIRKLFGKDPAANPRIRCTFNVSDDAFVWCPKMAFSSDHGIVSGDKKWQNTISDDKNFIYEKALVDSSRERKKQYLSSDKKKYRVVRDRIVFGKVKSHLDEFYYKFLGVYQFDHYDENNDTAVFSLKSTELDVSKYHPNI